MPDARAARASAADLACGAMGHDRCGHRPRARLGEITEYEQTVRSTVMTRVLRRLGPTKGFIAFYRRFGPKVDPWLMRSRGGRTMTRLYGLPSLLLDTIGVKTGLVRTSPLLYVRDGDDFVVVGTNFGQLTHPAWTANLLAHPQATIEVGHVRVAVGGELVDQAGWDRNWPRFRAVMRATPGTWRPVGIAHRGCSCCIPRLEHSTTTPRRRTISPQWSTGSGQYVNSIASL